MGAGDDLMASGMARGARARGKRIAFGDGYKIKWGPHSEMIFRGNPNVAPPGSEGAPDLEWNPYCKGNRLYNKQAEGHWEWTRNFWPTPGELFLTDEERHISRMNRGRFAYIDPNLPDKANGVMNKQWPLEHFNELALRVRGVLGLPVVQPTYGRLLKIRHADYVPTISFRHAAAVLEQAAIYIGHEGGMHHAAAALGVPAVVLFGSWIPPDTTGYKEHANIARGADHFCGSFERCERCIDAMASITPDEVQAVAGLLLCR